MAEETKEPVKTAPMTKIEPTEIPLVKDQHSLVASEVSEKPDMPVAVEPSLSVS
jgi:hypothetical protein